MGEETESNLPKVEFELEGIARSEAPQQAKGMARSTVFGRIDSTFKRQKDFGGQSFTMP